MRMRTPSVKVRRTVPKYRSQVWRRMRMRPTTVTYSLTNDYNGAFTINATTGVVTVADNTKLDYESDTAPTIEITATSTDGTKLERDVHHQPNG